MATMANFAYLRVSTEAQDLDNQRYGILEYSNANQINALQFIEDNSSGKINWRERKLGNLLTQIMQKGDTIVFAEISRMGRSTLQVLDILEYAAKHEFNVHIAKQKMILDNSMQARITATVLGLAAEIEREFISLRTKEALAKRKQEGKQLGRPKGKALKVKLDEHEKDIRSYIQKGISKQSIAKLVECAPSTLYDWLKRKGIKNKF